MYYNPIWWSNYLICLNNFVKCMLAKTWTHKSISHTSVHFVYQKVYTSYWWPTIKWFVFSLVNNNRVYSKYTMLPESRCLSKCYTSGYQVHGLHKILLVLSNFCCCWCYYNIQPLIGFRSSYHSWNSYIRWPNADLLGHHWSGWFWIW